MPAVWFALVSYPGRMWGCSVLFESGAIYRNLPPHALAFEPYPEPIWTPKKAQTWDCYGEAFQTIEYRYLSGLAVRVRTHDYRRPKVRQDRDGTYLFTAVPLQDGFSAVPEQAKEFTFVALSNGRLTIQPTNHVLVEERSFTQRLGEWPQGLKRQTDVWTCE